MSQGLSFLRLPRAFPRPLRRLPPAFPRTNGWDDDHRLRGDDHRLRDGASILFIYPKEYYKSLVSADGDHDHRESGIQVVKEFNKDLDCILRIHGMVSIQ